MNRSAFLFARPNFLSGVSRLFDLAGTLNIYNVSPNGDIADIRAFQEDWRAIGDDMRRALEAYQRDRELECHG